MAGLEGQTVKGYELRERIGGGGFGEVYRAFQTLLKREVAVKIILPQHANQPEFIRRFEVEAELVARLEHPHIVPLFDYWREPNGAYLVMRLLRGGSLEDLSEMGPIDPVTTAAILEQVAGALNMAHRNGVVHRDLKPANILLDEDRNAYLADFGIAKDLGSSTAAQTMEGLLTPNYAAPEQFKGEEITARTDLYNLGLMVFEMLTGRPPFSGALHEVIFKHISDPIPSVRDFVPDLPPAVDEVLQRATSKDPEDRYPTAIAFSQAFRSALASADLIETDTPSDLYAATDVLDAETLIEDTALLENPYKGLRAFREGDADDFFGRDELVHRLLGRLDLQNGGNRFLAVVGPSGSGKSSVVKAGLIPFLRRGALVDSDDWFITEMFPSSQPSAELEAALLRVAINPPESLIHQLDEDERGLLRAINRILPSDEDVELVLIIDQFEELFTQVAGEKARVHFLNSLRAALEDPRSRLRVIVTIRADFYDRPLQYEALGELMRRQTEVVLPLSNVDLERAIIGPAERVGVALEPGLSQAIIEDVGEQPGTLPLLQYALTELFERRTGRLLTLEAYTEIGGVTGALARRADELYRDFDAPQQEAARQLFLRLVSLGEGTEDTRRRVRRTELGTDPHLDHVIETFGQYRLLTFDRDPITRGPTVEVAHEALIRTWDRLRGWIEESREDLRIQRRLTTATSEWLASGRNPDFLASGTRLDQFEEWSKTTALALNQEERAYLQTSMAEQAARRARDEAVARRVQNLGRATAILVVMIVIAVIATAIFLNQASTAQSQADVAQTQVAQAGDTLTPIPQTLTPVQLTLAAGNNQLATAEQQVTAAQDLVDNVGLTLTPVQATVNVAQAQVAMVGQTLTPVQGTAVAAQNAANAANALAGTAQSRVESIGATLTPQQATVVAAQGLFENVGLTLTPVQGTVIAAQQQVDTVGSTLTPVQATVIAAQQDAAQANVLASTAQAQVDSVGATLTPVLGTAVAAQSAALQANALASTAQARVSSVDATLTPQQGTVVAAQALFENIGMTLTPVQGTVIAAQAQVEMVGATLTPVQATIAVAQAQLAEVGMTLTPVLATVAAADQAVSQANRLAADAQTQVAEVGLTLTPVPLTLTPVQATLAAAQGRVEQANQFAEAAQTQVSDAQSQLAEVGATLTPQQATVVAAQAQVEMVGQTLTPQQGTVIAAQILSDNIGATLTPQQATVIAAQAQVEMVGATLTPQQATIAAAQAQIENVGATLTPQQATVAAAQELSQNVGLTLTPVQATVAVAQAQVEMVGQTLTPVQATVVAARNDADSLSLAVSAEQAVSNGNYDLALALLLESIRLNPELTQAQRQLNQIAFNSPRMSFSNAGVVRFSPIGRVVAVSQDNAVTVWNIETRQQIDRLEGHSGLITDMAFSPNGQYLATASVDATAIIWDVSRWQVDGQAAKLHQLTGHGGAVNAVVFNNDSNFLLTGSEDTNVIRWDVTSGTEVQRYTGQPWPVEKLAYAEGGRDFYAWTDANGTRILNLWNGATGSRIFSDDNLVFDVFSPNMRNAFAGGINTPLQIYNAANRRLDREFTRGFNWATDTTTSAAFRPYNGSEVLVGLESTNNDNRLVLANVGTGEIVRQFQGDGARRVNGVAFNPDGTLALSGNGNQLVLWDVEKGTAIRRLTAHNDLVSDIAFSADGRYAISKSRDNNARIWDITSGDSAQQMTLRVPVDIPDRASPHVPGFHPSRNALYAGVWIDLFEFSGQTGQHTNTVSVGAPIIRTLYSPTQPQAVTILENVAVVWNLDRGTQGLVDRFANSNDLFHGAGAYSPNGSYLVLDGRSQIYVYDMSTLKRTQNIQKPQLPQDSIVTSLAISPDGTRVVGSTGNPDEAEAPAGDIIAWDVASGQELLRYPVEHTRTITSVAISPDGHSILTASDDNTLILWDLESGQVLKRFAGHTDDVNMGLFSPDPSNPFIVSGSDDGTIILWDINSAQPLRRLQGHNAPITALNLSPDGTRMVSATRGDTMIVWRIETPQQIIDWVLANRYVKPFTADECAQYNVRNCNVQIVIPTLAPAQPTQVIGATPTPSGEAGVTPTPIPAALKSYATNTGSSNVNVRSSDSTEAPIVDVLRVNERVEILGLSSRGTGWYEIILADGRLAWVAGSVVSVEGSPANIPKVDPPPVVAQPTRPPASTGGSGSTGGTGTGGEEEATEAPLYDCSKFKLTSPIGYINPDKTTFYWDPLPGVQANYWLSIFNEQGQAVKIADAGGGTSVTVDTSVGAIGGGFSFSYQVNAFVNGDTVCPATGSSGTRPAG